MIKLKKSLLSLSLMACFYTNALPVAPTEDSRLLMQEILGENAAELSEKFALFFDSHHKKKIWYVPKVGSLAFRGAGDNKRPIFNILTKTPSKRSFLASMFPREKQLYVGGAFSSRADSHELRKLYRTALASGYSVQAATASSATLKFGILGKDIDEDGYPDVNCELENSDDLFDKSGKPVQFVQCYYAKPNTVFSTKFGQVEKVPVPEILDVSAGIRSGERRLTNTIVPFNFNTIPSNSMVDMFQNSLENAGNLDALIYANINWELKPARLKERARINIDWSKTFESAFNSVALHNFACIDIELTNISEKLIKEGSVKIDLYNRMSRKWESMSFDETDANDDGMFIEAVRQVRELIENELFHEIKASPHQKYSTVNSKDDQKSLFVFKKNAIRRKFSYDEKRYVLWNPGRNTVNTSTSFFINCIEGGFGERVEWKQSATCQK